MYDLLHEGQENLLVSGGTGMFCGSGLFEESSSCAFIFPFSGALGVVLCWDLVWRSKFDFFGVEESQSLQYNISAFLLVELGLESHTDVLLTPIGWASIKCWFAWVAFSYILSQTGQVSSWNRCIS